MDQKVTSKRFDRLFTIIRNVGLLEQLFFEQRQGDTRIPMLKVTLEHSSRVIDYWRIEIPVKWATNDSIYEGTKNFWVIHLAKQIENSGDNSLSQYFTIRYHFFFIWDFVCCSIGAEVARSPPKRRVPGSIPGWSYFLFSFFCNLDYTSSDRKQALTAPNSQSRKLRNK